MEELWSKGEAGVDFDNFSRIIEPEHFQCLFLIMGGIFSLYLIFILCDILTNTSFGFVKLMLAGLFACLLITLVNLYFFSTALLTPITRETEEKKNWWGFIITPAKTIFTGDYEINMDIFVANKTVAFAILGYGALTSFIFIFIAMMRSVVKSHEDTESQHLDENNPSRKKVDEDKKSNIICKKIWSLVIIFLSIMILTLTFVTYLGLYIVLNNMTRPVQTVIVSSEGPAAEIYPDCMGQYNILREVYRYNRAVYKHVDREDRFIIYTGIFYRNHPPNSTPL